MKRLLPSIIISFFLIAGISLFKPSPAYSQSSCPLYADNQCRAIDFDPCTCYYDGIPCGTGNAACDPVSIAGFIANDYDGCVRYASDPANPDINYSQAGCFNVVCNDGTACGACTAPVNTCSINNGSQSCSYNSYTYSDPYSHTISTCTSSSAPSQSCTIGNCSAGYVCSDGICVTPTPTPTNTPTPTPTPTPPPPTPTPTSIPCGYLDLDELGYFETCVASNGIYTDNCGGNNRNVYWCNPNLCTVTTTSCNVGETCVVQPDGQPRCVIPTPTPTGTITPTPTPTPTNTPTPTPTPAQCLVTTSPGSLSLNVGQGGGITAIVTGVPVGKTVTGMLFGSYDATVATTNPIFDPSSLPYSTTATGVATGATAVWATAELDGVDTTTCQSAWNTDTDVNVAVPTPTSPAPTSGVPTPTPVPPDAGIENFYIYEDTNADGIKDASETYLSGSIQRWYCPCTADPFPGGLCPGNQTCSIDPSNCSYTEEKITNGSLGTPATYNLAMWCGSSLWHAERFLPSIALAGYTQTQPLNWPPPMPDSYWWRIGLAYQFIDPGDGGTCLQTMVCPEGGDWYFGFTKLYSISGSIFNDLDGDGVKDALENNYTGPITITAAKSGTDYTVVKSAGTYTTDVLGVKKLPAGTYTITFSGPLEAGFSFTYPYPNPVDRALIVTVGPSCSPAGLQSICSSGNIINLNAGVSDEAIPAWIQSVGSDMRWDSGFNNPLPSANTYASIPGTGGMPGIIFSGGNSPNLGGANRKASADPFNWQVGNPSYPDLFTTTHNLIPTSYNFLLETAQKSGVTPANITTLTGSLANGIYKTTGTGLTVDAPVVFGPGNFIILVDGSLNINANITVPPGSTAVFSAKDNVTVGANVTQIQGLYSADQDFIVDSISNCAAIIGLADNPLNVAGTVVTNAGRAGGTFVNSRTLCAGNITNPSVTFTERPDFMLNYPSMTRYTPKAWQNVAP